MNEPVIETDILILRPMNANDSEVALNPVVNK